MLYLSLQQSRQAWSSSLFTKSEPLHQRHLLGTVELVIGPHVFCDTSFYAAGTDRDIVFEFTRDNSGTFYEFPRQSVLERSKPTVPYQLLASFFLKHGPSTSEQEATEASLYPICASLNDVCEDLWLALREYTIPALQIAKIWSDHIASLLATSIPMLQDAPVVKSLYTVPTVFDNEASRAALTSMDTKLLLETPVMEKKGRRSRTSIQGLEDLRPPKKRDFGLSKNLLSARGMSYTPTHNPSNNNNHGNKKCVYCGCKNTPMWRRGPHGAGTLCNACGVKWKHGKILQHVSVFSPSELVVQSDDEETPVTTEDVKPSDESTEVPTIQLAPTSPFPMIKRGPGRPPKTLGLSPLNTPYKKVKRPVGRPPKYAKEPTPPRTD